VDDVAALQKQYDAVVLAIGSTIPRDLKIPGRELNNVDFAMTLLKNNTQALLDDYLPEIHDQIAGKNVIVIGGGDTGNDCIGTAVRHGAKSVVNFELLPQPPNVRSRDNPWPQWPRIFRVDYGHTEVREHYGKDPREYCILSKEFLGDGDGNVIAIKTVRVEWKKSESGVWQMNEIPNSEETFDADLVLLSMGFVGPEIGKFEIQKSSKGTIPTINNASHKVKDNLFAAGDCRRGQSLIVWGLQEGKQCAREVDMFLEGNSRLPGTGGIIKRDFRLLEELAQGVEQAA
jgi:glutamate synthase (NADPH/NADH)